MHALSTNFDYELYTYMEKMNYVFGMSEFAMHENDQSNACAVVQSYVTGAVCCLDGKGRKGRKAVTVTGFTTNDHVLCAWNGNAGMTH